MDPADIRLQWKIHECFAVAESLENYITFYLYTPCLKKNGGNFKFLSELCEISTNFDNFWQNDGKEAKIMRDALTFHLI